MITSKQRAYLRSLANPVEAILQIGKAGINDNLIKQVSDALEARELIKLTMLETAPGDIKSLGNQLAMKTDAILVQTMGKKITLYRMRKKDPTIVLPK